MKPVVWLVSVAMAAMAAPAGAQEALLIVRHAEKADASKDPPLAPAGEARARALAALLRDAKVTAIVTTEFLRTRATAEPLARALKLEPRVQSSKDSAALAARLKKDHAGDRVLVVGHVNTVPELLAAFGATEKVTLGEQDYDNLFVVVPRKDGPPTVLRLRY
jgi:broad specificity phosphatase PhoE